MGIAGPEGTKMTQDFSQTGFLLKALHQPYVTLIRKCQLVQELIPCLKRKFLAQGGLTVLKQA